MSRQTEREERVENGRKIDRSLEVRNDNPPDIQRAGGEDPRRYEAKILIDRKVEDHDMSGYNHNATPQQPANGGHENEIYMRDADAKVARMGTPEPDGLYRK